MPEVKITTVIDVWCNKCGAGLCKQSYGRRNPNIIDVDPCPICLADETKKLKDELKKCKEDLEIAQEALSWAE